MTNASFSAIGLVIASVCLPKRDPRWYLHGVNVRPAKEGGVLISGTNGHQAIVYYDKDGHTDQEYIFHVGADLIRHAKTRIRNDEFYREIQFNDGRLSVVEISSSGRQPTKEIYIQAGKNIVEGKFPDLTTIINDVSELKNGLIGQIHPLYMQSIAKVAELASNSIGAKNFVSIVHQTAIKNEAIVSMILEHRQVLILTMPMRLSECTEESKKIPTHFSFEDRPTSGIAS